MFVWKAVEGKIPTTTHLRSRGVAIPSVVCKVFGFSDETPKHVLRTCCLADLVWTQMCSWVKIPSNVKADTLKGLLCMVNDLPWSKEKKKAMHAVFLLTAWSIWQNRNTKVFKGISGSAHKLVEDIKDCSYKWMKQ
ncbi:putative reverse transcriptase zinc-binding domain-containing protein [Helianthus annuus]|nr:putative reverse transcriptase zinc-binding domain-containing protein [Helianthus annuus]